MKKIGIFHHLGMGDVIDCSAIVRKYSKNYDLVYIFSKKRYAASTKKLFRDLNNLNVIEVDDTNDYTERRDVNNFFKNNTDVIPFILGHENYRQIENLSCSEIFYKLAGEKYTSKYDDFYYQRDSLEEDRVFKKLNPNNEKFIFVHDDPSRNLNINVTTDLKIIKNDPTECIFDMLKILENAEEVHCMFSSFLCLIDTISKQIMFKKLYLHPRIRPIIFNPHSFSNKWNLSL
jgi:hypothetical protein